MNISLKHVLQGLEREELLKLVAAIYAIDNDVDFDDFDVELDDFCDCIDDNSSDLLIAIQNTLANVDREFEIEDENDDEEDEDYENDYEDEEEDEDYEDYDDCDDDCDCDDYNANREASLRAMREMGFDTSGLED